jgi:deoxyribonuclease V
MLNRKTMILAVDVDYRNSGAFIAGIAFRNWEDEHESETFKSIVNKVEDYVPGQFYRRELPCILRMIEEHELNPTTIVIDGLVYLDGISIPGLGKHLYDALNRTVNVVGVAKRPFTGVPPECEILRGKSTKPLYITSVGMPLEVAKISIKSMQGKYRVPTLLKKADQLCRQSY